MAQVRSFVVRPDHFQRVNPPKTFELVDPRFEKEVEERIDFLEKEVGRPHKTCQFFPNYRFLNLTDAMVNISHNECFSVYIILTF